MELLLIALVGLFAGLVKGVSGFGSSLVAFPLLLFFFPPEEVVVMLLTFNVVLNLLLLFENKAFQFRSLKSIAVLTISGVTVSLITLYFIGDISSPVIKLFAAILIVFAIINKLHVVNIHFEDKPLPQALAGIASGFGNGLASIDGPPVVFYLTGIDAKKAKFKNTLATYFLTMGLISVSFLITLGRYNIEILQNTAYVALFAGIGVIVGMIISSKLSEKLFSNVVVLILIGLGCKMFYDFIISII